MTPEQRTVAHEINQELAALPRRAKATGFDVVGYLVDMARLEAANAACWH